MTATADATEKPFGAWSILMHAARQYRGRISLLAVASFVGALLEAGFLIILTGTLLALAGNRDSIGPVLGHTVSVGAALAVGAGAVALRLCLGLIANYVSAALSASVTMDQRRRLAAAYLGTSWDVQQSEPSGRLQELLTSFVNRFTVAMTSISQGVTAALSLVGFLSTGLFVDPVATIAVLGALAVLIAVLTPLRRRIRARSNVSVQSNLAFSGGVSELGSLGMEMQVFGVQQPFADRIETLTEFAAHNQRQVLVLTGALTPVYTFLAYAAVFGGVAVLDVVGVGNLGAIGAVMLLMVRSLSYGQQLLSVSGNLASSTPFLERFEKALERYEGNPSNSGHSIPPSALPLEARGVSFEYNSGRLALSELTIRIDRGEVIGVIGPSGAGKSTLAQLLLGLRDPSEGQICVGGVDLRDIDRSWWSARVAFVAQEALLFTGTVAENLRFFRDGIGAEDLRKSAAQANLLEEVLSLPDGFDTHLGERGNQLSGGQRQRLSIARALVGHPDLLVLDEPTSALDGNSEALIRDTLTDLKGRVTIVIIAHRLSTLDMCDRIMVVEGGQMTALGTPAELRQSSAFFRRALSTAGIA